MSTERWLFSAYHALTKFSLSTISSRLKFNYQLFDIRSALAHTSMMPLKFQEQFSVPLAFNERCLQLALVYTYIDFLWKNSTPRHITPKKSFFCSIHCRGDCMDANPPAKLVFSIRSVVGCSNKNIAIKIKYKMKIANALDSCTHTQLIHLLLMTERKTEYVFLATLLWFTEVIFINKNNSNRKPRVYVRDTKRNGMLAEFGAGKLMSWMAIATTMARIVSAPARNWYAGEHPLVRCAWMEITIKFSDEAMA